MAARVKKKNSARRDNGIGANMVVVRMERYEHLSLEQAFILNEI